MTDRLRAAAEAALEALERSRAYVYETDRPQIDGSMDALRAALAEPDQLRGVTEMIDDRLRIERLVRANARRAMVIDIIERLVEDPERDDFGPSDMEYWSPLHDALQAKLRAALAEPEVDEVTKQEPVDDVWFEDRNGACRKSPRDCQRFGAAGVPDAVWVNGDRYVRREWQGLTDEEIFALRDAYAAHLSWGVKDFARAIEAALKEKNHGI